MLFRQELGETMQNIKTALCLLLSLCSLCAVAEKPVGFLWYNMPQEARKETQKQQKQGVPFSKLSYTQRDAVLHFYTMEALHRARQTKTMEDMRTYLALQDYWMKESSRFSRLFQNTLLAYPEYDYTVTHPVSSMGTKLVDETREQDRRNTLAHIAKTHGLLFFYRGNNAFDQKQIPILIDFAQRFHLKMIPVSVDGTTSPDLPQSRQDNGQADALGVRYFPAVLLVNPKTQAVNPIAYGLTTQDVLEKRIQHVMGDSI